MYLDDNSEYQTVWQLAHNWAGVSPDETDTNAIPPKIRELLIRLVLAVRNKKISARTRRGVIFQSGFIAFFEDIPHYFRTRTCLTDSLFNKPYLDSIYVKREEVIELCINSYYKPPDFWMPEYLPNGQTPVKEPKDYRPDREAEDRVGCKAIARALWELDPNIHPVHMVRSKIMQQLGNGRQYSEDTIKEWIKEADPITKRKKGAPPKIQYKIDLIKDPQLKE